MIEGVMNRSHWNRSRKSNMGFLLPTQGAPSMTQLAQPTARAVQAAAVPRRAELAASTHEHCTAASRWSIEASPTSVVNAGLIGAHACLAAVAVDLTAGAV